MMLTPIQFTKMHGLGNDFVVINDLTKSLRLSQSVIATMADRHLGIGFDQLLVIEPSSQANFFCRIYNADGTEAEQCGNGLRCVGRFIIDQQLLTEQTFTLQTIAGVFPVEILVDGNIKVGLGAPVIEHALTSLSIPNIPTLDATILSLGNPHAVIKVADTHLVTSQLATSIAQSSYFPNGVNIGFMQIAHPKHIILRTFERGVGETYACGSNACAAAVAGIVNGWLKNPVQVEYRYGSLTIEWNQQLDSVFITGPAVTVFQGELTI